MPIRTSLLISALVHTLLLWGAFASSLPFRERVFFVEIREPPPGDKKPSSDQDRQSLTERSTRPDQRKEQRETRSLARSNADERSALPHELPDAPTATSPVAASGAVVIGNVPQGTASPAEGLSVSAGRAEIGAHRGMGDRAGLLSGAGSIPGRHLLLDRLRAQIQGALVYPPYARKRRMEGTATVSFAVSDRGMPLDLHLVQGSGHRLLDEEALNTVRRAVPLSFLEGTVEVPISFRLTSSP